MRIRTLGLSLAALFAAHSATASVGADGTPPLRLIAPSATIPMVAGETAELEWGALAPFQKLPDVQEWEAFLSLDDGATYPIRITPHLDRDLSRISWQVPEFPSRSARLLLRFGDERTETSVEIPHRFIILPGVAGVSRAQVHRSLTARSFHLGESARPGDAGVNLWVEGSRRGGGLQRVEALGPFGRDRFVPPFSPEIFDTTVEQEDGPRSKARFAQAASTTAFLPTPPRAAPPLPIRAPILPLSPLLQTPRLNQ